MEDQMALNRMSMILAAGIAVVGAMPLLATPKSSSGIAVAAPSQNSETAKKRPNVLVIILDDVGFAAASPFGGPIETPALEKLAQTGITYNRFHTTAVCSPTRASLLTGRNPHRVATGGVIERPYPGYNWSWPNDAAAVPAILKENGYATAAFGKWHNTPVREVSPAGPFDHWPTGLGFEHFYGFMQGEDSQWEPLLYRNTTPVDPPANNKATYHFTQDITDEAISFVRTQATLAPQKPWFAYVATGGAHAPHHVPPEWIAKYKGRFDKGWDSLRKEVFTRQKRMGIIPKHAELTKRPNELPAWNSLTPDARKLYARQMEVFAGFLEHTDHEIGRLLDAVRTSPGGENTIIFYVVGDNGGSGEGAVEGSDVGLANIIYGIPTPVEQQLKSINAFGSAQADNHYSAAWAWATSTPFKWMKRVASAFGGTRNPLIVSWPGNIKNTGSLRQQFSSVADIAPTIYEVAGIQPPKTFRGISQTPLDGISIAYSFDNAAAPSRRTMQYFEEGGNRALYKDGWMATTQRLVPWKLTCNPDFSKDVWELYNIDKDFSQAKNLARKYPEKLKELQALFEKEAEANNVYPLSDGCVVTTAANQSTSDKASVVKRKSFTFFPETPRMPVSAAPNLAQSHTITGAFPNLEGAAKGVILTNGNRYGGAVLYVKGSKLIYETNFFNREREFLAADLPNDTVRFEVRFNKDGRGPFGGGMVQILINDRVAAERRFEHFPPGDAFGSFGIGRSHGGPVSNAYDGYFPFTGKLDPVKIEIGK